MSVIGYAVPGVVTVGDSIATNYVVDASEVEFYRETNASRLGSYMSAGVTEAKLYISGVSNKVTSSVLVA